MFNCLLENNIKQDSRSSASMYTVHMYFHDYIDGTEAEYTLHIPSDFQSYLMEVDNDEQWLKCINSVHQKRVNPASCSLVCRYNSLTADRKNREKIMNLIMYITPTKYVRHLYGF